MKKHQFSIEVLKISQSSLKYQDFEDSEIDFISMNFEKQKMRRSWVNSTLDNLPKVTIKWPK